LDVVRHTAFHSYLLRIWDSMIDGAHKPVQSHNLDPEGTPQKIGSMPKPRLDRKKSFWILPR